MSHKTDLQSNNVDLQSILATINALPEAGGGGGGGSVEVETVDVRCGISTLMGEYVDFILMYTAFENGVVRSHIITQSDIEYEVFGSTIFRIENVVIGTLLWISTSFGIMDAGGNQGTELVLPSGSGEYAGFMVNGADEESNNAFIYITCFE